MKNLHQSYFLVALSLGIIAGAIFGLVFRLNFFASPVWLVFAALLFIIAYFKPKLVFVVITFVAGLLISFFRVAVELQTQNNLANFYNQTITLTGVVDGDPNHDDDQVKLKFKNSTGGTVYVSLAASETNLQIARADTLTLQGKLSPGFGTYAGYFYRPQIISIERPSPGDLILQIREGFADRIQSVLPATEASLGLSYLLGMKTTLDGELNENLRLVGLVHIVVASGAHLAVLVDFARKIFGKVSRFASAAVAILFVLFFMTMVGFTPSILRAGIMSILTLVAWYFGRNFAPWRIIVLVAALTLVINPMFIIDLGWLLSFASFTGIMILGPKLTKFFYGTKKPKFIASAVITTISATLLTLPITLYYFGQLSLISVVANLLILPTLPAALGLVFLTGLTAGWPLIGPVIGFLTTTLLDFHIGVVNFFADQKSFLITIDPYNPAVFALYIIILLPLIIGLLRRKMVKLNPATILTKREKICPDTVNGPPPNVKKRS